ncbi:MULTISPECIES: divalent-cation tolerance protein CutA [Gammaproteobacteria]|uniref:divalent-cation tolerance protein CutA n=1 Tax=Gammaproteobacteria TaxID=1236 RepID=UPI000DCF9865|nr:MULTISPECIES: divalent-cation tolerance protein CutA [Gammaproteobacteria]RTE85688.1 divalent-cation tolerance protein CutA [Aliidiomarina sp. B3213]TCZ90311.1 divalent-cation tolerance protein CutA [Lysobacter sp. N42]
MSHLLIITTTPDLAAAEAIAEGLIQNNLAACVQVQPQGKSFYRWQGKVESSAEHALFIKTTDSAYGKTEQYIQEHHPYDVPEIIAVKIDRGLSPYLSWINEEVNS